MQLEEMKYDMVIVGAGPAGLSAAIKLKQLDKKNKANTFILDWWQPKTTLRSGIKKIFEEMKNDWV